MEKNTLLVSSSKSFNSVNASSAEKKDELTPSTEVINNILNYSKALKVEQCKDGKNFIEYITN